MKRRDFIIGCGALGVGATATGLYYSGHIQNMMMSRIAEMGFYDELLPRYGDCTAKPASRDLPRREASYYEKVGKGQVKCLLCPEACVLAPGARGRCLARINEAGKLMSLIYGSAYNFWTIGIKKLPLLMGYYGDKFLIHATCGCNLDCDFCITPKVAQRKPEELGRCRVGPAEVVTAAREVGCDVIHFSNNEPLIGYDYLLDIVSAAKKAGIKTVVATNGYLSHEPLGKIAEQVDSLNIGLKGFSSSFYKRHVGCDLEAVKAATRYLARRAPRSLSISYLVIPGKTDSAAMLGAMYSWVKETLGVHAPVLLHGFIPAHRWSHVPPTTAEIMHRAQEEGIKAGMKLVSAHDYLIGEAQDIEVRCPRCDSVLLRRLADDSVQRLMKGGRCKKCGFSIEEGMSGELRR